MGIFDGLEKLITEHGSAAILKERIALANDKYAALERKVAQLSEENAQLRAENAQLRANPPQRKAAPDPAEIDETAEKILVLLSKNPRLELEQVAGQLGIELELAAFYLEELERSRFIDGLYSTIAPTTYSLDQEGRRLLIKRGLLK